MVDLEALDDAVDPGSVDWRQVAQSAYLIHQQVRYEYPVPIQDLHHRLMVLPPRNHGDQRRRSYLVEVSSGQHRLSTRKDGFGNVVLDLEVPNVARAISFDAFTVVERRTDSGPHRVHRTWLRDRRLLEPSPLTLPDEALVDAAVAIAAEAVDPIQLASRICSWVYGALSYERGVTHVGTTAGEALRLGRGVCQDYAHVMIAMCRLCSIPARYVSGHLLGEGAMHAWVEVIVPSRERRSEGVALAFDPTHDRVPGMTYITVAVGRDFGDVSPTRGTFRARTSGSLSTHRRVSLTALQYRLI